MAERGVPPSSETPTDYGRPYRPWPVGMLNATFRVVDRVKVVGALDVEQMVAAARRKTELRDYGDDWFLEPLNVLVESANAEAALTPLGRWILRQRLVNALSIRLRAEELLRRHPEIHDVDFGSMILIAGLQRTGTTLLHRLIGAHPDVRSLRAWEALNPLPLAKENPGDPGPRIAHAKTAQRVLAYLAPTLSVVHPIEYDAPEEDILLLDVSFMSQTPEATLHVPTYSRWLERQDPTKAYEYSRTLMKLLHWQRPASHWVLKTPHHLECLDIVLKVFPQATVVQTHRDPATALVSFCSMVGHARGMFSDRVDAREIGTHWLRKVHRMVEVAMGIRDNSDPDRFVDVSFEDLMRDPIGEVRRIHGHAGVPFDAEAVCATEQSLAINTQNHGRRHIYSPGSFGLEADRVETCFAAYRSRFAIARDRGF